MTSLTESVLYKRLYFINYKIWIDRAYKGDPSKLVEKVT